MIETLVSGALTPVERSVLGFAWNYGVATRGCTTVEVYKACVHLCQRANVDESTGNQTQVLEANIRAADLVIDLCASVFATPHEGDVTSAAFACHVPIVLIAPGTGWQRDLKRELSKPGMRNLYLTGGTPDLSRHSIDERVDLLLSSIFNFFDPRDPGPSAIPRATVPSRVAALRRCYPYQFPEALPEHMVGVEPGWLDLLERLCADIDNLPEAKRAGFHWIQIKEKFGVLRAYWTSGASKQDSPELRKRIAPLISAAELASKTICSDCGAPGRLRERNWTRTLCDLHAKPGWQPPRE